MVFEKIESKLLLFGNDCLARGLGLEIMELWTGTSDYINYSQENLISSYMVQFLVVLPTIVMKTKYVKSSITTSKIQKT